MLPLAYRYSTCRPNNDMGLIFYLRKLANSNMPRTCNPSILSPRLYSLDHVNRSISETNSPTSKCNQLDFGLGLLHCE